MSWLYSRALVVAFSEGTSLGGELSALSSSTPTPRAYLQPDKMTGFCHLSQFGMTFAPLMESLGEALLTWFRAASRARTSALPTTKPRAYLGLDLGSGVRWHALSMRCVPQKYLLKTLQCLWDEDLPWSYVTLPKWGSMRNGELWALEMSGFSTSETDAGFMPTILKTQILETESPMDAGQIQVSRGGYVQKTSKNGNPGSASWPLWMLYHGLIPTPKAAEFFMDFPMGWTALQESETVKFQEWLRQHSTPSGD